MPLDINALHQSLAPKKVRLVAVQPTDFPPEGEMVIWKGSDNTWHFKTTCYGKLYDKQFNPQYDSEVVALLEEIIADFHPSSQDITSTLGPDKLLWLIAPYFNLSLSQQTLLIAALQYASVFRPEEDDNERAAACIAILNRAPQSRHDSGILSDLRHYLNNIRLIAGRNATNFLQTRPTATTANILSFVHLLLHATLNDLGRPFVESLPVPPRTTQSAYHAFADRLPRANLPVDDGPAVNINPSQIELACKMMKVEWSLEQVKRRIPSEIRERRHYAVFEQAIQDAVNNWVLSSKDITHLIRFRCACEAFLMNPLVRKYHVTNNFFGTHVSSALQELKENLQHLRDCSPYYQEIKRKTIQDWAVDGLFTTYVSIIFFIFYPITSSVNLLGLVTGFSTCFLLNVAETLTHPLFLIPFSRDGFRTYLEITRDAWSQVPLLISGHALLGAIYGGIFALGTSAMSVSLAVSAGLALSLSFSIVMLLLPLTVAFIWKWGASLWTTEPNTPAPLPTPA